MAILPQKLVSLVERTGAPDGLIRYGIRQLLRERLREEGGDCERRNENLYRLLSAMGEAPVALSTACANDQHYELPAGFFERVLGQHLKYSCCYYPQGDESLDEAEEAMLRLTCERARLENGQEILELGCGWGALTLWMARQYPQSRITAVSNSGSQREFIERRSEEAGLGNVVVVTADMNDFHAGQSFDRVISLEMFEHMRNWGELLRRISTWLNPEGMLFIHVFCHRDLAYVFQSDDDEDWMARHFFTDGLMPSDGLLLHFQDHLRLYRRWRVSGRHYERTCNHWLARMDAAETEIQPIFARVYGDGEVSRWINRWRIFFMACAELFGYRDGDEWHVAQYLMERRSGC